MGTHPIFESDFDCLTGDMDHTKPVGFAKWRRIYPIYVDSKRTKAQGRRLPVQYCCERPQLAEIETVLKQLGLVSTETYLADDKQHPKNIEKWLPNGSIKFEVKSIPTDQPNQSQDSREQLTKGALLRIIARGIIDHRDQMAKISAAEPEKKKKKRKKK